MLRRLILVLVIVLIAVPLILGGMIWYAVDTGAAKTSAEAAVERDTGHTLRIAGPVHIAPSLVPTLSASDVTLLNPPGFSRPDLAHARQVEAQVALLPLLHGRIEVRRLRILGLDAKLEVNAAGRGNWERPPVPATTTPAVLREHRRFALVLRRVEVNDSVLAWSGPGGPLRLDVPQLQAAGKGTLKLVGTLRANAVPLRVEGAVFVRGTLDDVSRPCGPRIEPRPARRSRGGAAGQRRGCCERRRARSRAELAGRRQA